MSRHYLVCFLYFLFGLIKACNAQQEELSINKFLPLEGQVISGAVQDAKGNLWFGTFNGLVQYNGVNVSNYHYDPLNPASLSSNKINALCVDSKENVWAGSDAGLSRLDPSTGVFINYHHIPGDSASLGSNTIIALLKDHDGYIWIGTDKGLDRCDTKTGKFKHFYSDAGDMTSLTSGEVSQIYEDRQGTLWIGTGTPFKPAKPGEGGLNKFNKSTNTFTRYVHNDKDSSSLADSRVRSIFEDSKGNFWIGTVGDGLHIMDRSKGTFTRYRYDPVNPSKLSRTPIKNFPWWDDWVTFINEDAAGIIWIGTCNGMNRYNPKTGKVTYYSPEEINPLNDVENMFWRSYRSRDGVFWISNITGANFKIDILHSNIPYHSFGLAVNSVYQESTETFWVGTEGKGLLQCDNNGRVKKKFIHEPSNPASISNDHIYVIRKGSDQQLWIGTEKGLNLFDINTQKFIHYKSDTANKNSLGDNVVNYVYEDSRKKFWVGTQFNGLDLMDRNTGTFTHYTHKDTDSTSLSGSWVSSICEDSRDRLLVGVFGSGGVNRLDDKTGKFVHYLKGSSVTCLYKDRRSIIWVGTRDILYYFDVESDKMVPYIVPQTGVNIKHALSMVEDDQNNLWICSAKGLIRLDSKREGIATYGVGYGVQDNSFGYSDGMKGPGGNIIFCDQSGYYSFFPDKIIRNPNPPELVLTDFLLQDQLIKPGKGSILEKPLLEINEIHLNHRQNFFSFVFNVVDYSNRTNALLFKLENYDNNWRKGNEDFTASYFNVQPGKYTLHIKGINSDGLSTEKSILIIVSPPWWKTWWAYTAYVLALATLVWLMVIYRSRNLKAQNIRLEHKVEARTNELKQSLESLKATQAQLVQSEKMASLGELTAGIAHEIQNPLNFVNNFSDVNRELADELKAELAVGNMQSAAEIAGDIKDNSEKINHHGRRADAIVKGMLQHSRSSSGKKEATDINALTDEYLRLAYHGLRAKDNSFNATIKTDFDPSIGHIDIIPQDIGRVILNLLTNAFYAASLSRKAGFSESDGKHNPTVWVSTKKVGDKVLISVKDNGPGIPQKILDKIFQPFFTTKPTGQGTGLGLSLSYDIVKAHGGELKVETKEGEGLPAGQAGSQFTILLPNYSS